MPMVIQACYECGDEICYEMDDLEAEAYFSENPHVNRDVDVVLMLFPEVFYAPKEDWESGKMATITTSMASSSHFYRRKAIGMPGKIPHDEAIEIMGLPDDSPMTCKEIGLSVPPEYAKFIASEALRQIKQE